MDKRDKRPAWWMLYLLAAGGIGLLVLDARAPLPLAAHKVIECGVSLLTYGLIALWLRANRPALLQGPYVRGDRTGAREQRFVGHPIRTSARGAATRDEGDGLPKQSQAIETSPRQTAGEPR